MPEATELDDPRLYNWSDPPNLHRSTSASDASLRADILMELEPMEEHVKSLIEKAAKADKPEDAMKLSQAALNAANAVIGLDGMKRAGK